MLMANTPHELADEFPDMTDRIRDLRARDGRFARLVDEYHDLNRQIHRVETRVEPTSEDVEEELKRKRVRLKDEIAQLLQGADKTDAGASPLRADPAGAPRMRPTGNS
jgi:uncharacterized protein YdcH (DUF465 family)